VTELGDAGEARNPAQSKPDLRVTTGAIRGPDTADTCAILAVRLHVSASHLTCTLHLHTCTVPTRPLVSFARSPIRDIAFHAVSVVVCKRIQCNVMITSTVSKYTLNKEHVCGISSISRVVGSTVPSGFGWSAACQQPSHEQRYMI
jgi:hypothetical protein